MEGTDPNAEAAGATGYSHAPGMEGLQHPVAIPEHVAMPANPGKGGRPKSSVWKFFETERKRDDKSKREDVRCRFCNIIMPGRAEGMERHIALDCQGVDAQAKTDMQQHLFNKKLHTLEKKGVKRKQSEGAVASGEAVPQVVMDAAPASASQALQLPAYSALAAVAQQQAEEAQQNGHMAAAAFAQQDVLAMLQQVVRGQQELRASVDNIPRRLRNSRAAIGEAALRPLCRERFGHGGAIPGSMPPPGLFPATWGEALRIDSYRVDQLVTFYGDTFGITAQDSLEEKQAKFLEWAGAVRP